MRLVYREPVRIGDYGIALVRYNRDSRGFPGRELPGRNDFDVDRIDIESRRGSIIFMTRY